MTATTHVVIQSMDQHFYLAGGISFPIVGVFMHLDRCCLNINGSYKYSVRVMRAAVLKVSPD